jgi:hypothetical protein
MHDYRHALPWAVAARIGTWTACLLLSLAGCAGTPERAARSSVGCANAVVAALPGGLSDHEKHCVASAGITQRCSRFEAWLAGWAKEIEDAFSHGDASWEDLDADRIGRRCATTHDEPGALIECCRQSLTVPIQPPHPRMPGAKLERMLDAFDGT